MGFNSGFKGLRKDKEECGFVNCLSVIFEWTFFRLSSVLIPGPFCVPCCISCHQLKGILVYINYWQKRNVLNSCIWEWKAITVRIVSYYSVVKLTITCIYRIPNYINDKCVFLLTSMLCSVYSLPTAILRLPWLRFFRAFSSVVRPMPGYTSQRRGTVHTLPN